MIRKPVKRERAGSACWRHTERPASVITPALRQALADLIRDDPARFIAVCVEVQVVSLRQVPAYVELTVSAHAEDRWLAAQLLALAKPHGITH